jgi:hypothetical protein
MGLAGLARVLLIGRAAGQPLGMVGHGAAEIWSECLILIDNRFWIT